MDDTQKYIQILKEQLNKLMQVLCAEEFNNWKNQTKLFITKIYGENSTQINSFSCISPYPGSFVMNKPIPDQTERAKKEVTSFLDGVITELEAFGLPNTNKINKREKISNININNNISQTQNIELSFIVKTIKDELPLARLKEVEDILSKEEPQETKLNKIGNILKNAGIEVLASTLAKIIAQVTGIPVA